MSSTNVLHSQVTVEHYTPTVIVEAARAALGGRIDLDPASCALANKTVGAERFFDAKANGFKRAWSGHVFLNPPGGRCDLEGRMLRQLPEAEGGGFVYRETGERARGTHQSAAKAWWFRLAEEWCSGRVTAAVFLGFSIEILQVSQLERPRGLPSLLEFALCFPKRRLAFLSERDGVLRPGEQNTHGSVIAFLHGRVAGEPPLSNFAKAFDPIGGVVAGRLRP